jgi:hypothetical protein
MNEESKVVQCNLPSPPLNYLCVCVCVGGDLPETERAYSLHGTNTRQCCPSLPTTTAMVHFPAQHFTCYCTFQMVCFFSKKKQGAYAVLYTILCLNVYFFSVLIYIFYF